MKYFYSPEVEEYFTLSDEDAAFALEEGTDIVLMNSIQLSENEYYTRQNKKENEKMSTTLNSRQVVTGEVRLSYVTLFEPKKFGDDAADPKYSVTILINKNTPDGQKTIANIKTAIAKAAEEGAAKHFGGRVPTSVNNTLKDGDTEVDDLGELKNKKNPEYVGHMYMRLSSKFPPKVLNEQRQEIINPLEVYSGCYGRVSLTTFAYSNKANRGVSAVLNNVMKTRDGDPLTSMLMGDEFGDQ